MRIVVPHWARERRSEGGVGGWRTYRIVTNHNTYILALYSRSSEERVALLRSLTSEVCVDAESARTDGGDCLFETAPGRWVGQALQIGDAVTSTVKGVAEEANGDCLVEVTGEYLLPGGLVQQTKPLPSERVSVPTDPLTAVVELCEELDEALGRIHAQSDWRTLLNDRPAELSRAAVALHAACTRFETLRGDVNDVPLVYPSLTGEELPRRNEDRNCVFTPLSRKRR